jgi:uncharacterized DUF497 family protein
MIAGFEWDPAKRAANLLKHGIDFVDSTEVFRHHSVCLLDPRRPHGEERFVTIGLIGERLVAVIWTLRASRVRIISARKANRRETRAYRDLQSPEA